MFQVFPNALDDLTSEDVMRNAAVNLGSLGGVCINPVFGTEAKSLPPNSFSWGTFIPFPVSPSLKLISSLAWTIGRSIALSRSLKLDPISTLLSSQHGTLLFTGKIISVTRYVSKGFTRGNVLLAEIPRDDIPGVKENNEGKETEPRELFVDFENENLNAVLKVKGKEDSLLAICPDLITVSPLVPSSLSRCILSQCLC